MSFEDVFGNQPKPTSGWPVSKPTEADMTRARAPIQAEPAPPAWPAGVPPQPIHPQPGPDVGPQATALPVDAMLLEAAATFRERSKQYGNDYLTFGKWAKVLFPNGIALETEADLTRFSLLVAVLGKLGRYVQNFGNGGHDDSLKDLSVYATILRHTDEKFRIEKETSK